MGLALLPKRTGSLSPLPARPFVMVLRGSYLNLSDFRRSTECNETETTNDPLASYTYVQSSPLSHLIFVVHDGRHFPLP